METGEKLDNIQDTVTEIRVSMAALSGDVRASLARHDASDVRADDHERRLRGLELTGSSIPIDVETRLRTLERRNYAIPGLATILGLAAFALSLWTAFGHHA